MTTLDRGPISQQTGNTPQSGDADYGEFSSFRHRGVGRAGVYVVLLAVVFGVSTFAILTGLTPVTPSGIVVFRLLVANLVLLGGMAIMIGWQILNLLIARQKKLPGAVLHARIVGQFALFAAAPALIIAFFATVTLNRGLDTWFNERTQSIIQTSINIGDSYVEEQLDLARGDISGLAANINQSKQLFYNDRQLFLQRLATIVSIRNLSGVFVFRQPGFKIEASITVNRQLGFRPPSERDIKRAEKGELVVIPPGDGNVIRALMKLKEFENHYVYLYRLINPNVTSQVLKAREQKVGYDFMLSQRTDLQLNFAMMYVGVALIFLLAAIWFGMWFADKLVAPIVSLVRGAKRVSLGDLEAKVKVSRGAGDLATLGHTFNQMTSQLNDQRGELVSTNHKLDERRRFIEAVMAGVSSGVIGIDPAGQITLVNRSALKLLGKKQSALQNHKFVDVLPEMAPILEQANAKASGQAEGQISMKVGDDDKAFVVQVTTERASEDEHGVVVTFDDISDLVAAQRNSAWADIARRIAHEIKNPLTPIQLAAERLKRKYQKEISSNPEVFDKCTETIIRQVGDIRGMVDEFSSFARMPTAHLEPMDFVAVTKDALVLQKASFEDISFEFEFDADQIEISIDRRLVNQAITNLVKNAKESIDARLVTEPEPAGRIKISVTHNDVEVKLAVIDNGIGLPRENRARLTEPYMTTRAKGTGLGLAIVKRIVQDHDGKLTLTDAPKSFDGGRGAKVTLSFPFRAEGKKSGEKKTNKSRSD